MLSKLAKHKSAPPAKLYEPAPRWGHYAVQIGGQVYMWGGYSKELTKAKGIVSSFDPYVETWSQQATKGNPPPVLHNGACASSAEKAYTYGGTDGPTYCDVLSQLDTNVNQWTKLSEDCADGPMRKCGCRMVCYDQDGDKLALFGGAGIIDSTQPGSTFIKLSRHSTSGLTNEFHVYNLKNGTYMSPTVSGIRPPPCSHFSFTMIDHHRAVLFGGHQQHGRTNDAYIIDFKTMHWSKLEVMDGGPQPVGRSSHAAVCLDYDGEQPQLLVTGGRDSENRVLRDAWILDVTSGRWREVVLPDTIQPRCFHSTTAIGLCPGLVEVIMFGGIPEWPRNIRSDADFPVISGTTILRFESIEYQSSDGSPSTREWILTDVTDLSQQGSTERLREKMMKIQQATHQPKIRKTHAPTSQVPSKVDESQREYHQPKRHAPISELPSKGEESQREYQPNMHTELPSKVDEFQREYHQPNMRTPIFELPSRGNESQREYIELLERRVQQAEERAYIAELREAETERRLYDSTAEAIRRVEKITLDLRTRLEESQQTVRKYEEEKHRLEKQWVVQRDEIQFTGNEIGSGGWAAVRIATFRGIRVAAKSFHHQIISRHNRQLFRREMNMAALIRHPNLVQFIGATLEGDMVILTELMPTSLRYELEKDNCSLSYDQIVSISLDVAKALNYLHLMQPDPIIHRDISSSNVLLEPLANDRWRAKVTDYGSVNLLHKLQTVGPGSPLYAPPEANDPKLQSTKMDIFSFGALLLEMLTLELPAEEDRSRLIRSVSVTHPQFVDLIRQCLQENREHRPTARHVIEQLCTF